jgi:hypothetical protein
MGYILRKSESERGASEELSLESDRRLKITDLIDMEYKYFVTKADVKRFIADEKKRLYNRSQNIRYRIMFHDYDINVNKGQFMDMINQFGTDEEGFMHPHYDDDNRGLRIIVYRDEAGKKKTTLVICI